MLNNKCTVSGTQDYRLAHLTTAADFEELFIRDMNDLYGLALLLTADFAKAVSCLAAALDDCVHGISVFRDCANTWARRAVAKHAIAVALEPDPWLANRASNVAAADCDDAMIMLSGDFCIDSAQFVVLDALERVVYVLCAMEGYSVQDCARLIGRTAKDVAELRVRASAQVFAGQASIPVC